MKLSEAIRLGAMMGPQLRGFIGHVRTCDGDGDMCELIPESGTCAQGAALVAIAARWSKAEARLHLAAASLIELHQHWLWLSQIYHCPACSHIYQGLNLLPHLNDDHEWTREHIADYIATIEPAEIPAACPEPVAEPEVLCSA